MKNPNDNEDSIKFNIWKGNQSSFGNWGHVSLETSNKKYLSIWPERAVKPTNPLGKILPAPATINHDKNIDELAEADVYADNQISQIYSEASGSDISVEDVQSVSLGDDMPEPKKADEIIEFPVRKDELSRIEENFKAIEEDIKSGKLRYCGYDVFDDGCINCITGIKKALRGTSYEDFPCDKGTLPHNCAEALKEYKEQKVKNFSINH